MDFMSSAVYKLKNVQKLLAWDTPLLPHIVVVGAQGAGKSSLIENIIGQSFLPHTESPSTRCPVIIKLHKAESEPTVVYTFGHLPDKKFTDCEEVKEEIIKETEVNAGKNHGISTKPILLQICSQRSFDLTIIDLPGLAEIPLGEQPPNVSMELKKLSLIYMRSENTVVLAVVPATTDIATNECLRLCRMVDSASRTIVVVTKLDLVGPGVDVSPTLRGEEVRGFSQIIGVVCRSFRYHKEKKKNDYVLKQEKKILQSKYPQIAHEHGTPFLLQALAKLLRAHLRLLLPDFRHAISNAIYRTENELDGLGEVRLDANKIILEETTRYAAAYCSLLTGTTSEIEINELVGGARINYIFQETFSHTLDSVNPLTGLSKSQILTALRNTCGTRPDVFFIPEVCFENLARRQIQLLMPPCRLCVELVYDEMIRLVKDCSSNLMSDYYPTLYDSIFSFTAELIERCHQASVDLVEELLDMEVGYINSFDPQFQHGLDASKVTWLTTRGFSGFPQDRPTSAPKQRIIEERPSNWLSGLLYKRVEDEGDITSPSAPPHPPIVGLIHISPKDDADCLLVENLISSYMTAVRRSLKDSIPKAIMLRMVNYVHDQLYRTLLENFQQYRGNEEELLRKPQNAVLHRQKLSTLVNDLKKADSDLQELHDKLRNLKS